MRKYKLSLLIPSWNDGGYLRMCISSLLKNTYKNYEIILIVGSDNEDTSYQIALSIQEEHPKKIKLLKQKIPNKNQALNLGLEKVEGDIIILTDIDCKYQRNYLEKINNIFQKQKCNVITGSVLPYQENKNSLGEYNSIVHGMGIIKFEDKAPIIGNKLCGANAAFRKKVFLEKIGKFDESIKTGDDKILGMHFNKLGIKVYFFHDIYVFTDLRSKKIGEFIQHQIRWARDLFISKLTIKEKIKVILSVFLAFFKLSFPILIILLLLFVNPLFFLLFLSWISFFLYYQIKYYFELKRKAKKIDKKLGLKFNYKKAWRAIPLLFFVSAVITIISFMYPRRHKW